MSFGARVVTRENDFQILAIFSNASGVHAALSVWVGKTFEAIALNKTAASKLRYVRGVSQHFLGLELLYFDLQQTLLCIVGFSLELLYQGPQTGR